MEQDRSFIQSLKTRHRSVLAAVKTNTESSAGDSVPTRRLWPRIERHLYPALEVRRELPLDEPDVVAYCRMFLLRFSMPVVLWDEWTDKAQVREESDVLNGAFLSFHGQLSLDGLRRSRSISLALNSAYARIVRSALDEERTLFTIPSPRIARALRAKPFEPNYYRSLCGYFSAIVTGLLILAGRRVSTPITEFLRLFGVLRQIADDIADVQEDLTRGLVTLPVIHALDDPRVASAVDDYWHHRRDFGSVQRLIDEAGGYERAYEHGIAVYSCAGAMAARLGRRHRFVPLLMPFFELKRLLLLRLRENHWDDALRLS